MKNILILENNVREEYLSSFKITNSSYPLAVLVTLTRKHIYNLTLPSPVK